MTARDIALYKANFEKQQQLCDRTVFFISVFKKKNRIELLLSRSVPYRDQNDIIKLMRRELQKY